MLQALLRAGCRLSSRIPLVTTSASQLLQCRNAFPLSVNVFKFGTLCSSIKQQPSLLSMQPINFPVNESQVRTVIKYSLNKGKRKSVKPVLKRFFRLHWGIWIRTRSGRHKKLWKKTSNCRQRMKQHVFCNATQSYLLDKMVTKFWRTPKYYVDDPYEPYHTREEFPITHRKPVKT